MTDENTTQQDVLAAAERGDGDSFPTITVAFHPHAEHVGARRVLARETVTLGRASEALGEGVCADELLSRRHVELECNGTQVVLRDLGSRNGTFVNGKRVVNASLAPGDIVGIGGLLLLHHRSPLMYKSRSLPELVGRSAALARVLEQVDAVATHPVSVLITGESGVGKEIVARAIHDKSGRRGKFVAVNCGAVSDSVLQSEMFGHVKGAFSGAAAVRAGLVETAAGGTLFLDEIGDASAAFQQILLRLLEQREYRPLGSDRTLTVDVRFVAATHVTLERAVDEGRFRRDVLGRLQRWCIHVPPLRDRLEDVIPLALHFARVTAGAPVQVSRELALALLTHRWPSNIRELQGVIEQAVVENSPSKLLELTDSLDARLRAREPTTGPPSTSPPKRATPSRPRRPSGGDLRARFLALGGSITDLADELGVSRNTLYRWFSLEHLDLEALRRELE